VLELDELATLDGLISPEVGELLHDLASKVAAEQAVVELGSYRGKSTSYLARGAKIGKGAPVFAVDAWSEEVSAWRNRILSRLPSATYREFLDQLTRAGVKDQVTPLRSMTTLAAEMWADMEGGQSVGLLYIDGDHHFDAVLADFRAWRPHLTDDATVVFDDYDAENNPGVLAAVQALVESKELVDVEKHAGRLAVGRVGSVVGARVPGVTK
jgi:predicted O-methyltransferase YrrM